MKTEKLIEELDHLVMTSGQLPLTSKRIIEEDDIMRIIDAINESLPLELQESRKIVAERDYIISEAHKQADSIIAQAKEYIRSITNEHELVQQAQNQANQIMVDAGQMADNVRQSAVSYASDLLKYVEGQLEGAIGNLRENRSKLAQMHQQPMNNDKR